MQYLYMPYFWLIILNAGMTNESPTYRFLRTISFNNQTVSSFAFLMRASRCILIPAIIEKKEYRFLPRIFMSCK